jgi:hypothetical protein
MVEKSGESEKRYAIPIFDPCDAEARDIKVVNYDTLNEYTELIIADGWFDTGSKQTGLNVKI